MVAVGQVRNGVIVLEHGIRLPEGQTVTVITSEPGLAKEARPASVLDIPAVSLGRVYSASADDDLLGEMLEDRQ